MTCNEDATGEPVINHALHIGGLKRRDVHVQVGGTAMIVRVLGDGTLFFFAPKLFQIRRIAKVKKLNSKKSYVLPEG